MHLETEVGPSRFSPLMFWESRDQFFVLFLFFWFVKRYVYNSVCAGQSRNCAQGGDGILLSRGMVETRLTLMKRATTGTTLPSNQLLPYVTIHLRD